MIQNLGAPTSQQLVWSSQSSSEGFKRENPDTAWRCFLLNHFASLIELEVERLRLRTCETENSFPSFLLQWSNDLWFTLGVFNEATHTGTIRGNGGKDMHQAVGYAYLNKLLPDT